MRRLLLSLAVVGLSLLPSACTNPFQPVGGQGEPVEVSPEVKSAVDQFVARFNSRDADGVASLLAEDPGFNWTEDGRVVYATRAAAVTGLTNFFAGFGQSRLEAYEHKVTMLSEDAAVATFKFTQILAANDSASLRIEGAMTLALAERDGTWVVVVAHKSGNSFPH